MGGHGGAERGQHDGPGDPVVRGQCQRIPGMVIQPGQDLGAGAAGQRVVGEVRLPALVGQLSLEAYVGRLRALPRLGDHQPVPVQVAGDRRGRDRDLVMAGQVPADRVRPGVRP
jgi:hypothetical protein